MFLPWRDPDCSLSISPPDVLDRQQWSRVYERRAVQRTELAFLILVRGFADRFLLTFDYGEGKHGQTSSGTSAVHLRRLLAFSTSPFNR